MKCLPFILLFAIATTTVAAEEPAAPKPYTEYVPPELRDIGIDEKGGAILPLDLSFTDHTGTPVTLRNYFDGKRPVVIQLGYFGCPQLCTMVSQGMVQSLKELTLNLGTDYRVLYISFDPTESWRLGAEKRQNILREYGRGGDTGIHLLTGSKSQIDQLTEAVGYRYKYVANQRQFSHPAVLLVCTPDGRLSRYLYGIKFDPRTTRLSLVEASEGKIGSTIDRILLTCFMYDGATGKYGPRVALLIMQAGGALTVITMVTLLVALHRRERRRAQLEPATTRVSETETK